MHLRSILRAAVAATALLAAAPMALAADLTIGVRAGPDSIDPHWSTLGSQAEALHMRLTPFRRQQLRLPRRTEQSLAEHRAILAAIAARDAAAAAETARGHITVQGQGLATMIARF